MSMSQVPAQKYPPKNHFKLSSRQWIDQKIERAPIWTSVDLRDGNQSLPNPMSIEQKTILFDLLANTIGFKEIEVGFPSASTPDYDFTRKLIDENLIPPDVAIGVLTQAREDLIVKTMDAIKGAKNVIFHVYVATSQTFQNIVFKKTKEEVIDMATSHVRMIRELAAKQTDTKIALEFSLEHFSDTDMQTALDVSNAVVEAWGATPDNKLILNLPATVEVCPPHVYADMIAWMSATINKRDSVIISVHPHNDRGSGVVATEYSVMAGADRVEGCLFGQGERTGNVCVVTAAMNMYVDGVHPKLNFSNMPRIVEVYEKVTGMKVPPRHPYAGELVFTAFSGSHQDAINKGMRGRSKDSAWNVPYLPIDPEDVGCTYEKIIRVNNQSGKAGSAFIIEAEMGLTLPRDFQKDFTRIVQAVADESGAEISSQSLCALFKDNYVEPSRGFRLIQIAPGDTTHMIKLTVQEEGKAKINIQGEGNGPISAVFNAFGVAASKVDFSSQSIGNSGSDAMAAAYIKFTTAEGDSYFGVGLDTDTAAANIKAAVNAINNGHLSGTIQVGLRSA